jgi:hypothetical protein
MIFIIQNAHAVNISFLGAHLRLLLAVPLLFAAIAGGLIMAATGTARITQLRRIMRRDRHKRRRGARGTRRAGGSVLWEQVRRRLVPVVVGPSGGGTVEQVRLVPGRP